MCVYEIYMLLVEQPTDVRIFFFYKAKRDVHTPLVTPTLTPIPTF